MRKVWVSKIKQVSSTRGDFSLQAKGESYLHDQHGRYEFWENEECVVKHLN